MATVRNPNRYANRSGMTQLITGQARPVVSFDAPFEGRFGGTPFSMNTGLGNIDPMIARAILGDQLRLQAQRYNVAAPRVTEQNQEAISAAVAQGLPLGILNKIPVSGLPPEGEGSDLMERLRELLGLI